MINQRSKIHDAHTNLHRSINYELKSFSHSTQPLPHPVTDNKCRWRIKQGYSRPGSKYRRSETPNIIMQQATEHRNEPILIRNLPQRLGSACFIGHIRQRFCILSPIHRHPQPLRSIPNTPGIFFSPPIHFSGTCIAGKQPSSERTNHGKTRAREEKKLQMQKMSRTLRPGSSP